MKNIDISYLLNELNEEQRAAVTAESKNLLVLAGAGSGKTRVLVHRIGWLIERLNVSPFSILAMTFTNKAAASMRGRIEALLQQSAQSMWIGTFHGICHRLLRLHWQDVGLEQNFQIIDSDDQLRLIKRILKELNIDEEYWVPRKVQNFINGRKDAGQRANQVEAHDFYTETMTKIYVAYEEACQRGSIVDFAELMLRAYEVLLNNPSILLHYQQRFRYILVDEFQDTNALQYSLLRLLTGADNHIMIVGDDDQSIYGWRGAEIENIHRFLRDFEGAEIIRLEENYRSTKNILAAANAVISNNQDRLGKELRTQGNAGDPIALYAAFNEIDEARFVAERIQHWINQGSRPSEVGVLYRSNAQSRILEEALIRANIPYRIYGGFRFFERAEIKDALAYLRLINVRHDDAAFERIINIPTRGLGDRTLMTIRELARAESCSLWCASEKLLAEKTLTGRAANALQDFITLINELENNTIDSALHEQADYVIANSGLLIHYGKERGEKARARIENLEELITAARQFIPDQNTDTNMSLLTAFLSHTALESGDEQSTETDCVQMMTLHAAKGLEFPLVFIVGVEEGLFPHPMSSEEPGRLEEERRLFYVGVTRAQRYLCLCYAEIRRMHGNEYFHRRSRFIGEVPAELIQEVRLPSNISRPVLSQPSRSRTTTQLPDANSNVGQWRIGQRVCHAQFGEGIILNYEGSGAHTRVQINFEKVGVKWLVEAYAKLEALA